jgi:hypothetical protein
MLVFCIVYSALPIAEVLMVTNALAYYDAELIRVVKSFKMSTDNPRPFFVKYQFPIKAKK